MSITESKALATNPQSAIQMTSHDFKRRTQTFALRVLQLVDELPRTRSSDVIGKQLLRCATSVGANYRSACRGRSTPDFLSRMGIVEEEADESIYWLEMLVDAGLADKELAQPLIAEANELTAMTVASIRTARKRHQEEKSSRQK